MVRFNNKILDVGRHPGICKQLRPSYRVRIQKIKKERIMNKKEKEIIDTMADKLITAINLLTAALTYHANVIGYKADDENPTDDEGKQEVKLELATEAPDDKEPVVPKVEYTFENLKEAINAYARAKGKDAALAMVEKYAGSLDIKAIPKDKYSDLMAEL